ncbi:TetR/AcrR family transcriptional regulator [Algoriphagus lacus]|uniref:TetR/AcrR family transcriptional regulator n=1 Tax=Algoriphagus lacus TaxID=2056311 RepID=A0A418PMG1_9BACT|nr:TetR/AcrR family transcriptional regulator [Algoriphagus lacus]RIW12595.1 TetR/AcrR family transcriptional regulator [Algoriphagus lacus]
MSNPHLEGGTKKSWIDLGYSLFSEEGHEGLQVERLARILKKNKSGYYHYFGDRFVYMDELLKEHLRILENILFEIQQIREFEPEYMQLMMRYKQTVLFQMQLVKNREVKDFFETAQKFNLAVKQSVAPVFANYLNVPVEEAPKYWEVLRDSFYSRVTFKTFSPEWIGAFARELKDLLENASHRQVG